MLTKNKVNAILVCLIIVLIAGKFIYLESQPIMGDEWRIMSATLMINPLNKSLFEANNYNLPHPVGSYLILSTANSFGNKPVLDNLKAEDMPSFSPGSFESFNYVFNQIVFDQRLIVIIFSLIYVALFCAIIFREYGMQTALIGGVLILSSIDLFVMSRILFAESFQMVFLLLAFMLFIRYEETKHYHLFLLSGLTVAVACTMKINSLFFILGILLFALWKWNKDKKYLYDKIDFIYKTLIMCMCLIILTWHIHFYLVYMQMRPDYGFVLYERIPQLLAIFTTSYFSGSFFLPLSTLAILCGVYYLWKTKLKNLSDVEKLFICFGVANFIVVILSFNHFSYSPRYFVFMIIGIYFFSAKYLSDKLHTGAPTQQIMVICFLMLNTFVSLYYGLNAVMWWLK